MRNVIQCYRVLDPELMKKSSDEQDAVIGAAFGMVTNYHLHDNDNSLYYIVRVLPFDDTVIEKLDPDSEQVANLILMAQEITDFDTDLSDLQIKPEIDENVEKNSL